MSKQECSLAILAIASKHNMSYASVKDILKLFSHVLPPDSSAPSYHLLMKELIDFDEYITIHHCCGFCTRLLSLGSRCLQAECLSAKLPDSTFIEVQVAKQLEVLFSGMMHYVCNCCIAAFCIFIIV